MSINDWYGNRAHRYYEDPRYDPENDDPRDPLEFGAVREIRSPVPEQRRNSGRATQIGPGAAKAATRKSVTDSTTRQAKDPGGALPAGEWKRWEVFARTWFSRNPAGSARACRDAALAAGLPYVTKRMASAQLRIAQTQPKGPVPPAKPRRQAEKPSAQTAGRVKRNKSRRSQPRSTADVTRKPTVVPEEDRCQSCDMVPNRMTGACRCG